MIFEPTPFKGLHNGIPIRIPTKGRGFIDPGSTLLVLAGTEGLDPQVTIARMIAIMVFVVVVVVVVVVACPGSKCTSI